jgi:hypothetical protein
VATDTVGVVEATAVVTADDEAAVGLETAFRDCLSQVEPTPDSQALTEIDGADGSALEPDGDFLTAEAQGSYDLKMESDSASVFTTEPNLSDEPPIVLGGDLPWAVPSGPGAMTREQITQYRAAMDAVKMPPIDPRIAVAAEELGKQARELTRARLKERDDKLDAALDALDAKERRESAEFWAEWRAKFARFRSTAVPKGASNPDAPRAPPERGAPAG